MVKCPSVVDKSLSYFIMYANTVYLSNIYIKWYLYITSSFSWKITLKMKNKILTSTNSKEFCVDSLIEVRK